MKEALRVRRKARGRFASSKATTGWEKYAMTRKKVNQMVETKKKGIWKCVVNKTNEAFEGGMKQIDVGRDKRNTGQPSRRGAHGNNSCLKSTER